MSIQFHCEHCNKEIKAPDTAGGRRGKCPACHKMVYVPSPESDEELKLAPLDTSSRDRERELMAETHRLTQDILKEREIPDGPRESGGAVYEMSDNELRKSVIAYLRQLAEGDLDEAETTGNLITPFASRVTHILDEIALSDMPEPELADISQQLLSQAIRALRAKMG